MPHTREELHIMSQKTYRYLIANDFLNYTGHLKETTIIEKNHHLLQCCVLLLRCTLLFSISSKLNFSFQVLIHNSIAYSLNHFFSTINGSSLLLDSTDGL